ncbi:inositol 2-dehydrogenase [Klebsiella indica]|uniref:Inositol 2-dehydrogenase n=1 Tax=Klebsiella indica TaxID=2582917 RepID=A0A5R9L8P9_9ENTR|nr:inositol 2-dehydrogenase [Klebsiella indica]TLV04895.1 inositol 2-dehydrogenase [Klebsiella indica]
MIKVGIIGIGRIGRIHGESIVRFVKGAEVKAIADNFIDVNGKEWAHSLGIKNIYTDYKKLLLDEEIDAVMICSPTETHSRLSIESIAARKHVFCEKPVDLDVFKINSVREALKGTNLKYQVGFMRRFDHNFKSIKNAISSGKIGSQRILKLTSRDPAPPSLAYLEKSGGLFLDMTIHDFDAIRFLSGSEVIEVFAQGAVMTTPSIKEVGDIDTGVVILKLSNGATAIVDNCRQTAYGYDQRAEVFGERGCVAIDNDTFSSSMLSDSNGVHLEKPLDFFLERYKNAYIEEIHSFIHSIESGDNPEVSVEDGLEAVMISLSAQKSLKENRPVKIEEVRKEFKC